MKKSNSMEDRFAFQRVWNASGLSAVIVVDNSLAHHSDAFKALAARMNVSIRYPAPSRPAAAPFDTAESKSRTRPKRTASADYERIEVDHTPLDVIIRD